MDQAAAEEFTEFMVVRVEFSGGTTVQLRPVTAYGRRWIGLLIPAGRPVSLVTVYAASAELAHSTPFIAPGGSYGFYTWLPPGDAGPARVTAPVNSALVPGAEIFAGPWGNCIRWPATLSCFPLGSKKVCGWQWSASSPLDGPMVVELAVRPEVAYLVLTLPDGRKQRWSVVHGAGVGVVAFKIPADFAGLRWHEYDSAGTLLAGGHGAP